MPLFDQKLCRHAAQSVRRACNEDSRAIHPHLLATALERCALSLHHPSAKLSRQLATQLLGEFFHSLQLIDDIFRQQSTTHVTHITRN